jgi:outer membrane protein OmpA-like peptidoglycan-associated protein
MTQLSASSAGSTTSRSTMSTTTTRRRLLVRRDADVWPFVWRGLLPLLGLLLVGLYAIWPFARGTIEASVQRHVAAHLEKTGFGWARVAVSGQQVVLSGSPPALEDGAKAIQSALGAQCPTWAGLRTCAISVVGAFAPALPSVPTPSPAALPAPSVPPAAAPAAIEQAKACAAGLNRLLEGSRIQFASGRAEIAAASNPLLDQLAAAAKDCPGNLRIEGHTDNIGDPQANRRLSLQRSEAVKAALVLRGLLPDRVETAGFGADRPVGDNATADGRAQNRRIEFHPAGS